MKVYEGLINNLQANQVFVFGSNPEGIHGAGTARIATLHYGAIMGNGRGHMGQSYGLVTKNLTEGFIEKTTNITYEIAGNRSVSRDEITDNILELYEYAKNNPELEFLIAYTDQLGLNGYLPLEMAEMFLEVGIDIPENIILNSALYNLYNDK